MKELKYYKHLKSTIFPEEKIQNKFRRQSTLQSPTKARALQNMFSLEMTKIDPSLEKREFPEEQAPDREQTLMVDNQAVSTVLTNVVD